MYCLGIDQSIRSTGVCVTDENGHLVDYHLIAIDEKKKEGYNWILEKFGENKTFKDVLICKAVADKIEMYIDSFDGDIGVVNIEGLAFGIKGDATRKLGGLQFMIIERLLNENPTNAPRHSFTNDTNNNIMITAPTSLKKFATGRGNSEKQALFDSLPDNVKTEFEKFPKTKGRFDLVDAYWLSRYGVDIHATG